MDHHKCQFFLDYISLNKNRRKCLKKYHLHKNPSLFLKEHCFKAFLLVTVCLFLAQSKLAFKFNPVLIRQFCQNLFMLLLLIFCISWSSSTASKFFYQNQQSFDEDQCCFWKFTAAECSHHFFIFHETFVRIMVKITPGVNNFFCFYMVWKSYCKQFSAC